MPTPPCSGWGAVEAQWRLSRHLAEEHGGPCSAAPAWQAQEGSEPVSTVACSPMRPWVPPKRFWKRCISKHRESAPPASGNKPLFSTPQPSLSPILGEPEGRTGRGGGGGWRGREEGERKEEEGGRQEGEIKPSMLMGLRLSLRDHSQLPAHPPLSLPRGRLRKGPSGNSEN